MQLNYFNPGDTVEVVKTSKFTASFHPATILLQEPHLPNNHKLKKRRKLSRNNKEDDDDDSEEEEDIFLVQYQTQQSDIVSYVGINEIRPAPPQNDVDCCGKFSVNDKVDVLRDGYWIKGTTVGVLYEGTKYLVGIDGDNDDVPIEVCRSNLRVHRDWCDGSWVPPFDYHVQKESFKMEQSSISRPETINEGIADSNGKKTLSKCNFTAGTLVEVRSDEDGYQGSWYTATVVCSVGIGKFLVEYQTLSTDDETKLLRDVANEQDIRPYPPHVLQTNRYNVLDEIDAWYNDGWWEGAIYEVLDDLKYIVYFATSNEKLVFQHPNLRPHQNWVDGKWIMHRSSDSKLRISTSERKYNCSQVDRSFGKGMTVEVRSDEPGYEGSWYNATIVTSTQKGRFLVEYMTLKTEDERNFLREEAEAQNIRPCPPIIEANGSYLLYEKVDAWYNDGWWEGLVFKVLADNKYMVYFTTSKEELEFHHVNLRAHQEWTNGQWIKVI